MQARHEKLNILATYNDTMALKGAIIPNVENSSKGVDGAGVRILLKT